MRAEVAVLLDERVEGVPLLLRRLVRPAGARSACHERDLRLAAGNVDEVVPGLAVAVHVTRVDERVTVTAVPRETVALADLHEDPDPGLKTRRPGLGVRGGPDDPMPWAEFGVAQLRFVGVTLHRLVLPQHARDFRRFQVVARVGEAVPDARGQPGCEVLAQLGCDVDGMPVARVIEDVDSRAAVRVDLGAARREPGRAIGRAKHAAPVERPPVRAGDRAHRRTEIGVPHDDRVDVLPIHQLERSEHPTRKLVVDREIRGPDLRPLELRIHRVDIERLLERGGVAGGPGRPQRTRREQVRVEARIREHVPDPYERHAPREDPGATPHLGAPVARGVPVEAEAG